jgi:hypothetical protein
MAETPTGPDAPPDALVAAVFRPAIQLGIATPADLVPWADGQILSREQPAAWILDLSLSTAASVERADDLLRPASAGADPAVVFRLLVGLVETLVPWTLAEAERACRWLWVTAGRFDVDGPMISFAGALDDDFQWAAGDVSATEQLVAQVRACIAAHADPAARAWLPGVLIVFG